LLQILQLLVTQSPSPFSDAYRAFSLAIAGDSQILSQINAAGSVTIFVPLSGLSGELKYAKLARHIVKGDIDYTRLSSGVIQLESISGEKVVASYGRINGVQLASFGRSFSNGRVFTIPTPLKRFQRTPTTRRTTRRTRPTRRTTTTTTTTKKTTRRRTTTKRTTTVRRRRTTTAHVVHRQVKRNRRH
jgi:hypothetical protein